MACFTINNNGINNGASINQTNQSPNNKNICTSPSPIHPQIKSKNLFPWSGLFEYVIYGYLTFEAANPSKNVTDFNIFLIDSQHAKNTVEACKAF